MDRLNLTPVFAPPDPDPGQTTWPALFSPLRAFGGRALHGGALALKQMVLGKPKDSREH